MEADRVARARRYVRLPEECVSLCTENLGIQTSGEVTSALVEDVSFRIRQVTKVRCNSDLQGMQPFLHFAAGAGVYEPCK